jgi:hypothetical protein
MSEIESSVAEETAVADAPVAEADAPAAETEAPEVAAEELAVDESVGLVAPAPKGAQQARVYLCERGHRTTVLWSEPPATCQARPTRNGGECGRPIYHMTELPEQVQKALNPLKASKKKAGKK